jgi:GNAT superfamily N-acetyltransferase
MLIRPPVTASECEAYYAFRWKILREPWNQPLGSERDDFEGEAIHLAAWVDPTRRSHGVGKAILQELESRALELGMQEINLNSRQDAVPFYQKNGYQVLRPAHTLFGTIPHFEMWKRLPG